MTSSVNARGRDRAGPEMGVTIEFAVHLRNGHRGRRRLRVGEEPAPPAVEPGCVPRISRLVALAIRLDALISSGAIRDYAAAARLGHVSRARMSQLANLTLLAPDIAEQILFLCRTVKGRDAITERDVRPIAAVADWRKQRSMWRALRVGAGRSSVLLDTSQRGAA